MVKSLHSPSIRPGVIGTHDEIYIFKAAAAAKKRTKINQLSSLLCLFFLLYYDYAADIGPISLKINNVVETMNGTHHRYSRQGEKRVVVGQ